MFFRGAPFQRDGPGGCNLVPASPLFSTTTDLVPSELTTGPQKRPLSTVSIYRLPSSGLQRRRAPNSIAPTLLTCASGWHTPTHSFCRTCFSYKPYSRFINHRAAVRRQGGGAPSPSRQPRAHHKGLVQSHERVTYVRRLLGNRIRSFDHGRDSLHLRGHPLFPSERIAQHVER
jgi:hypothetical protein